MKFYYYILSLLITISLTGCDGKDFKYSISNFLDNLPFFPQSEPCKNLHKVIDVDDLVQQMYANIDSTCLFDMPASELEKIWDIKVFDSTIAGDDIKKIETFGQLRRKYIETEENIFLEKDNAYLQVLTTKPYINKFNTWKSNELGLGKIPSYLPKPDSKKFIVTSLSSYYPSEEKSQGNDINSKVFVRSTTIMWLNSYKSQFRPALEISSVDKNYGSGIRLYRQAKNSPYVF